MFIGAFFFLNLTLAVINSSYAEAQAKLKAQKEKLRLEQLQIRSNVQKKDETENNTVVVDEGRSKTILGV